MAGTIKRAERCPVSGFGWLYLRRADASRLEGGPSKVHPDPHQSGQNPAYTEWGTEQIRLFIHDPYYQEQVREQMRITEKSLRMAEASLSSQLADLERLHDTHDALSALLSPAAAAA